MTTSWRRRFTVALLMALSTVPFAARSDDDPGVSPQLELNRLDGSLYRLNDSRGTVTVVAIWSPESLASRKCIGELQRFKEAHSPTEIVVMAASTLDDPIKLRRFSSERQLALPLATIEKTNLGPFAEPGLPYLLVFDRQGKLRATHRGLFRLSTLEGLIAPLQ